MDELEKYLKNHKDNIQDSFEWKNEDALWAKIEQKLDEKTEQSEEKMPVMLGNSKQQGGSVTISYKNLWRAAAVFVIFFAGYGAFKYMNPSKQEQTEYVKVDLKKINPELAEAEVYYTSMIQQKKEELEKMNPENLVEFEKDFQTLDSTYQQLKIDFYKNPNHEQVTNAMIQNLKLRIEILERQIEILEKYSKPQKKAKMKKLLYKFAFILSIVVTLQAQAQDQEARKTIQKSYSASGMNLKITNSYGKVHINTTSGNQINVKVEMIAKASSKSKADEILDKISVATTQSGNLIAFETILSNMSGWSWGGKTSFEINYIVDMPSTTPLEVYNKYGNTYVGNCSSKINLQTAYGNIKAERLTGNNEKGVQVKYGNAQVAYIEQGNIYVAYGNLDLEQAGTVKLKNSYSNTDIGNANILTIDNAYGNLEIDRVEQIDGDTDYAGKFVIKSLGKSMNMTGSYNSSFKVEGIDKNCQSITIDSRYSDCSLYFNEDAGCQFELNLKYGSLVGDKEKFSIQNKSVENTSSYYQGKYGRNHNTKVQITAKYGNVKIK